MALKHLTVSHWNPRSWSPTPNGVAWGIGCSVNWFSTTVLEPEVAKEVTVEAGIPSWAGVRDVTTSWVLGRLAVLSTRLPVAIVLLAWLRCERWITLSAGLKDSWVTQSYCWLLFGCQFSFNSYVQNVHVSTAASFHRYLYQGCAYSVFWDKEVHTSRS